MSIKVIYNKELISLLNSIFYESPIEKEEFLPIVKDLKNIANIIPLLTLNKNVHFNLNNAISLIFFLKNLFLENNDLMPLFIKNCNKNKKSLLTSLVDLYLEESIEEQAKTMIEDLIYNINFNVSISNNILEYIYQKLNVFFNINQKIKNENTQILTEPILLKFLKLLNIFYTDIKNENKIAEKKMTKPEDKIIRNYFYFNGLKSGMTIKLNKTSNNLNIVSPSLIEGFSIIFYVNLDKELLDNYCKYILSKEQAIINLIKIIIGKHTISLELKDSEEMVLIIDGVESEIINISKAFNYNIWNCLMLIIEPKSIKKKGGIKVLINETVFTTSSNLPKGFSTMEKIDSIVLFENLIGKVTSILLFSFVLENKLLNYFNKTLYGGFYKNKLLIRFLHSIDKDFWKGVQNFKDFERYKNDKIMAKIYNLSIALKDFNKSKIVSVFCPFMYNPKTKIVDDAFGIFIANFKSDFDGSNIFSKNIKNISKLGGINNLLPIGELMLYSLKKNNNYLVDKNLLTETTFLEYLKIIKQILSHHKESILTINNNYFFSSLGLFLEKYPPEIFSEKILNILLEICQETFRYKGDNNYLKLSKDNSPVSYRFISIIIFNKKIISKFSFENQLKIWDGIYNFFKKDSNQIHDSLDIPKIINLLRFYDKERYEKFCCKTHASLFEIKDENEIISPQINSRIGKLSDIIQLYIDKTDPEINQINLYQSLCLDLSSCLKKKIIQIYELHFINDKISDKIKERTFNNLLKNNYLEITEYIIRVSLLDVRAEILKLLHIILIKYKDKFLEYITKFSLNSNQIFSYLGDNILPIKLKIKSVTEEKKETNNKKTSNRNSTGNYVLSHFYKDNLFGANEGKKFLSYYFNKKQYDEDISSIWGLFSSWITENTPIVATPPQLSSTQNTLSRTLNIFKKDKENTENKIKIEDKYGLLINPFILSFCIDFVSNTNPVYIDSFLSSILFSIKEKSTQNKDELFKDQKFFKWLVDTIYFFHNKENENAIEDKDLIASIQQNSLQLIVQMFKIKTTLKEIENKIYYLLEYSFYFKKQFISNTNISKEIERITRLIFEQLLKSSELYFNIKSIFCFEFMFLFRNGEEVLSNFNYNPKRCSLLETESLKKTLKKSSRSSVDYKDIETFTERNIKANRPSIDEGNDAHVTNEVVELIPRYYYQGMYSIQHNYSQEKNVQIKKYLKNIWSDYEIYSTIINFYRNNIWGPDVLFKTVKMIYKPEKNIFDSCQDLLNNYGDKDYKNILLKKINKLVIVDDDYQNNINNINLLYLNIILLCFSMDIASVLDEQEKISDLILEFLIFCVLASINISPLEDTYNYIQVKLYDTLSFGLLFLKDKDEPKYRELLHFLIEPFFEGLSKTLFNSKKSMYKNSAIYKVFLKREEEDFDRRTSKMEDVQQKKVMSSSLPKRKFASITKDIRINMKNKLNIKKKNKGLLLLIRANTAQLVKTIFQRVLNFYKEEKFLFNRDKNINLFYFKNEILNDEKSQNNNSENILEQEQKRINIFIKNLIPNIYNDIKKTSISSYLEEKKRRNNFKKIKKSLFSWNGFWTDKTLFLSHPENLKYKIKNHLCKDMSKILLSPILDLNYYLPKFSKFNVANLFNKNDYKYYINLDADDILNIYDNKNNNETNTENYIKKNKYKFNYLECLYKNQFNNIWDNYYSNLVGEKSEKFENNIFSSKEVFELVFQNKLNSVNEENIKSENLYDCCIVKPTHHIKGYITTEKESITFTYCPENESKELLEKDPSYDKDMGACFGSTFKTYFKDKDKICLEIKYKSLEYMFKRNYFYQEIGLEIFTYEKKSYFLNFKSNQELEKFISDIIQHEKFRTIKCYGYKGKKLIGYCKLFNVYLKKTSHYINNKMEEWQNHNISTFEYLMWLNTFAGRSFNDLTQYPVFPWIITNYDGQDLVETDFRNLSIPVGMFDFNEKAEARKETFIEFYKTLKNELKESTPDFDYKEFLEKNDAYFEHYNHKKLKNSENNEGVEANSGKIEINQLPYFYGSHYSNPTYVSHYLTRLFPHASISIEIHGDKFDDPERIFSSMYRTFETASTLKDDVRELIPEFFILPEIFLNSNNLNLSQDKMDSEGKKIDINDVQLPPWSTNRCTDFVIEMRKNLERSDLKINKWVDLIFGYLQKGEKAEENNNIFMLNTYENMVKIENIKDEDEKNALMRLVEVGVTPIQLLSSESKVRNEISQTLTKSPYSFSKGPFLSESTELKCFNLSMYKYQKLIQKLNSDYKQNKDSANLILPRINKIKAIHKNEVRIFTNCNFWFNLKFVRNENKYIIEESSLIELFNISSKYAPSYQISNIPVPIVVFGHNKYTIKGGFWDGRIEINVINPDSKEEKDNIFYSIYVEEGPVVVMEISKDETILICGTIYGYVVAYQIEYTNNNTNIQLNLIKKLYDHNSCINSISINDNLNLFATCASDEYICLYLLPTFEIFRAFKIHSKIASNQNEQDELLIANNVFLSNSPLPCVTVYINSKRVFRTHTINGEFIGEIQENNNSNEIKCYNIFHDLSFCEYLIYGTDDGMVKIRSFPDMNLINSYNPFKSSEIVCLEISFDKRYCYAWSQGAEIAVIRDISVNDPTEVEQKKFKFK